MEREARRQEAREILQQILSGDPNNRFALEAMGYLYREDNDPQNGGAIFQQARSCLSQRLRAVSALGDLYVQVKQFDKANTAYDRKLDKLAPQNPVVISNAANAAIENQQMKLAGLW